MNVYRVYRYAVSVLYDHIIIKIIKKYTSCNNVGVGWLKLLKLIYFQQLQFSIFNNSSLQYCFEKVKVYFI